MKKLLLGAAAVALLGTVGCKKDYTCTCDLDITTEFNGTVVGSASGSYSANILDAKEDDAKAQCDEVETNQSTAESVGIGTVNTVASCSLTEM